MSHLSPALAATLQRVRGRKPRGRLWNPWIIRPVSLRVPRWCSLGPPVQYLFQGWKGSSQSAGWQTVGGSVASRFPSLCLLVFRRFFVCDWQEIHGLFSLLRVNQHGRLHGNKSRGLCTWHNPGIIHKASWVGLIILNNSISPESAQFYVLEQKTVLWTVILSSSEVKS